MNIWTVFFLVVSVVILASPLFSSRDVLRSRSDSQISEGDIPDWDNNELELDLASGRITMEDYEIMAGRKVTSSFQPAVRAEGDDGNLSEG